MKRLSSILLAWGSESRRGHDALALSELLREQGRFDEAEVIILTLQDDDEEGTSYLISKLIKEKQSAPSRYRM
jgi:hypothetical protein